MNRKDDCNSSRQPFGSKSLRAKTIFIGTAGWGIASRHAHWFPKEGSHLERYAGCLNAVEINSSFYRSHKRETYLRWAKSVPENFRFSVKLPKTITHERRLSNCRDLAEAFLAETFGLGAKLGVILTQFPPSLHFDADKAESFFDMMREVTNASIACEPRHCSWFSETGTTLLQKHRIARVAADPSLGQGGDTPAGWPGLAYFRFHGSPHVYYSNYPPEILRTIDTRLEDAAGEGAEVWCIFDNTAEGHALDNAVKVSAQLADRQPEPYAP
jgi:uncharacterized protein YecE (DUF72 family)